MLKFVQKIGRRVILFHGNSQVLVAKYGSQYPPKKTKWKVLTKDIKIPSTSIHHHWISWCCPTSYRVEPHSSLIASNFKSLGLIGGILLIVKGDYKPTNISNTTEGAPPCTLHHLELRPRLPGRSTCPGSVDREAPPGKARAEVWVRKSSWIGQTWITPVTHIHIMIYNNIYII